MWDAIGNHESEIPARLLRNGADPNFVTRNHPQSSLNMAISCRKDIEPFLNAKTDFNLKDSTGQPIIFEAARSSFVLMKKIHEMGADIKVLSDSGQSILSCGENME